MKIGIVGQGAIGSLFAYYFKTLSPVLLVKNIDVPARTIIGLTRESTLLDFAKQPVHNPFTNNAEPYIFDFLLITVKGYQLAELISQLRPWVARQTRLVIIQNGMGGAQLLAAHFPQNLIYAGTTTDAVYLKCKDTYQISAEGRLDIGPLWNMLCPQQYSPNAIKIETFDWQEEKDLIDNFIKFHPFIKWHHNISEALYTKLAINGVINPLTAVLKVKNGQLRKYPEEVAALKKEIFAVYAANEITLPAPALSHAIDIVIEATANNWSSMYQDIKQKRLTENETVLGFLLSMAELKHLNTPFIAELYQHLRVLDAINERGL